MIMLVGAKRVSMDECIDYKKLNFWFIKLIFVIIQVTHSKRKVILDLLMFLPLK